MKDEDLKISFFCIARDEEDKIGTMLASVADYVDEIVVVDTGSIDKTKEVAEKYADKIVDFEWIDDFSAARNFAMEQCTHEIIFWLDCDDTLINGDKLRENALVLFDDPRNGGAFMIYQYAFDDSGNCTMEHWKMRLFRKNTFTWGGKIHEDPLVKWDCQRKKISELWVKHHKEFDASKESSDRNLKILLSEYEANKDEPDPRILFYLANTYSGMNENDKAIEFYDQHFTLSGWDEERYVGLMAKADCLIRKNLFSEAIDVYLQGIKLIARLPDAFFGIGQCYLSMACFEKTEEWIDLGFQIIKKNGKPDTEVLVNPRRYDLYPIMVLEDAYMQQGKIEKALPLIEKIIQFMPDSDMYKERLYECKKIVRENELIKLAKVFHQELSREGDNEKIQHLAQSLPKEIFDLPSLARLRNEGDPNGKELCLYCGPTHELWSPQNVKTGIGGSEEAVINVAQELNKLGYVVTVYSFLPDGEEGDYDGVMYKNFWEINPEKEWDTVIIWRNSMYLDVEWHTRNLYVWLHDMQEQTFWNEEKIEAVDKVFVLSEFHRKNVPYIPDEKIFITSNGIDVSHFKSDPDRNPHAVIYASSPDRGLDHVLAAWDDVHAACPEATLDIYYGFTKVYDSMYHNNPRMLEFKEKIMSRIEELKDKGVTYHGRVGHLELAEAMCRCGVWAYPTDFPEISCITAMKMQAAGCVPVSSNYAAISETIQYGFKLETPVDEPVMHQPEWHERFTKHLITALTDVEWQEAIRAEMIPWAKANLGWDKVAQQWDAEFSLEKELVSVGSG